MICDLLILCLFTNIHIGTQMARLGHRLPQTPSPSNQGDGGRELININLEQSYYIFILAFPNYCLFTSQMPHMPIEYSVGYVRDI